MNNHEWETLLPSPPSPLGSYVPALRVGEMGYTSGCLPLEGGKLKFEGKTNDLSTLQAAARLACLNAISALAQLAGGLDQIDRIVKVTGFVNSAPEFIQHSLALNGASDLLGEMFGTRGRHVRSAIGVTSLPLNAMVELEVVALLKPL